MRNKEQSTVQSTEQSSVQSSVQSTEQSSVQSYVYDVGMLVVLAIGVCIFFAFNTFQPKNKEQANEKKDQPPKRRHML